MATITKKKTSSKVESVLSKPYKLIVHNDDYNTFDWVITCLMKICKHEQEQVTQCARRYPNLDQTPNSPTLHRVVRQLGRSQQFLFERRRDSALYHCDHE